MPTAQRLERIRNVAAARQQGIVIIEDVHDPHNAEAVLRSCDAFSIQTVYFIFEQEPRFNPMRVGRASSSSANKWLDYEIFDSTEACLQQLHEDGYETYATVLSETATSLYTTRFDNPKTALLLGNEHRGLSEKAIQLANHHVIIPMQGFVQSFNLSVTASIFMYELTRQRMERGMEPYLLGNVEARITDFLER